MDGVNPTFRDDERYPRQYIGDLSRDNGRSERKVDCAKGESKRYLDKPELFHKHHKSENTVLQNARDGRISAGENSAKLEDEFCSLITAMQTAEAEREAGESRASSLRDQAENIALKDRIEEPEYVLADGLEKNNLAGKMMEDEQTQENSVLTDKDILSLRRRLRDSEQERKQLRTENHKFKSEIKDLKHKLHGTASASEIRLETRTAFENRYQLLQARADTALNNSHNLQSQVQGTKTRLQNIQQLYEDASNEIEDLLDRVNGIQRRLSEQILLESQSQTPESRARHADAEVQRARSELRLSRDTAERQNSDTLEAAEKSDVPHAEELSKSIHPLPLSEEMEEEVRGPSWWYAPKQPEVKHMWRLPDNFGGC